MAKDLMDKFGPPDEVGDGTASWTGSGYDIKITDSEATKDVSELGEMEPEMAREALINELRLMIKEAVNNKNIKLAYKIERTLGVILEGEDEDI
jgi:hypothetical protein